MKPDSLGSLGSLIVGAPLNQSPIPELQWVEVSSSLQIPAFHIIGLPGPEVSEARERVRAAVESSGLDFPKRRIVLNLSPANIRKQGTGLDLAMALAVLNHAQGRREHSGQACEKPTRVLAWGELGLDGSIKDAGHRMRTLYSAQLEKIDWVILPPHPKNEEALQLLRKNDWGDIFIPRIISASTLSEAWVQLQKLRKNTERCKLQHSLPTLTEALTEEQPMELKTTHLMPIRASLARALGISAAGAHHLLLLGPKGTGKSHALEWLSAIQPPSSWSAQITQILLAELNTTEECSYRKSVPIRRIGSSARASVLQGSVGALSMRVGEYSLAHGGLLIADEFLEWPRDSRESLREPLETGKVTLSRARGTLELPALFTLAANGNLCPCGGQLENPSQDISKRCRCLTHKRMEYLNRLSGPVLDRIDLVVKLSSENLQAPLAPGKTSVTPRELYSQVLKTRAQALKTYGKPAGLLRGEELEELLQQKPDWLKHLNRSGASSLRSRHKVLRIALSLALWDDCELGLAHFIEAASYRHERLFKK